MGVSYTLNSNGHFGGMIFTTINPQQFNFYVTKKKVKLNQHKVIIKLE